MKVTSVETIWNPRWSNFIWVRVNTDDGLTDLGETFRHPTPVIRYVHDHIAPYLLGADPRPVALHADSLANRGDLRFLGYPTRSVEIRANSAIDIALWDLKSKAATLPLCELLGGPVRSEVPIYNTCAGPAYNWQAGLSRARIAPSGGAAQRSGAVPDDLQAQIDQPGELPASLLEDRITAMKIWPFDAAHLALPQPNTLIVENVRAFYRGTHRTFVTELPNIEKGSVQRPPRNSAGAARRCVSRPARATHLVELALVDCAQL